MKTLPRRPIGPIRTRASGWSYQRKPLAGYVLVLSPFKNLDTTFLTVAAALRYIRRHEQLGFLT
jgi:hypothetical protein